MRRHLSNILKDERGATSIEYALLGVLVSVSIIVGASTVGASVSATFQSVADALVVDSGAGDDNGNEGGDDNGNADGGGDAGNNDKGNSENDDSGNGNGNGGGNDKGNNGVGNGNGGPTGKNPNAGGNGNNSKGNR